MTTPVVRDAEVCPHHRVLDASALCGLLHPGNDLVSLAIVDPHRRAYDGKLGGIRSPTIVFITTGSRHHPHGYAWAVHGNSDRRSP